MYELKKTIYLFLLLFACNINAQSTLVKVLDSITLSPIPFATVYFSNSSGIISDENGHFELIKKELKNEDSLFIARVCIAFPKHCGKHSMVI